MEERYQESFYKKVDKFQGFDHVYVCHEKIRVLDMELTVTTSGFVRGG